MSVRPDVRVPQEATVVATFQLPGKETGDQKNKLPRGVLRESGRAKANLAGSEVQL
jgi:hypothetical protein